jgi:hypothetical protein
MADSHLSLLKSIARHRQGRADQFASGSEGSAPRRAQLARAAERAHQQVTAAAARRRLPRER